MVAARSGVGPVPGGTAITHVIDTMDPAAGGPPQAVAALASAQRAAGCSVRVIYFAGPATADGISRDYADVPAVDEVCWNRVSADFRFWTGRPASLAQRLGISGDSRVLHLHGMWRPELLRVSRLARRAGVPYVVAPLGMLAPWSLARKKVKKAIAWRLAWKRVLDAAAAIHALNEEEALQIRARDVQTPIEILPNGVFLDQVQGQVASWPSVVPPGERYVLFLGRLHEVKGLDVLAEAFAALAARSPGVRLLIAGPDAGRRDAFTRQIAGLGIAERVHVLGPVYGRAKWHLVAHAACLCQPSRQEGFSMSIVEALGAGVPVVISEQCHFAEVRDAGAGAVVPLDARAVARALEQLLTEPARWEAASRAARELVRARYQWPDIAIRTLELYGKILNSQPAPSH